MADRRFACIVGARPNFMKMAPILRAFEAYEGMETVLIHTGQHYDKNLSDVFFEELAIKRPDVSLGIGSGSHAEQTANLMIALEKVFVEARSIGRPFERVVVVGDVNSTMAAAVVAAKLQIPIAHVEAGLRSFDRRMPEEINRIITDGLSDMLLVSEPSGVENLQHEGHNKESIRLVGNVMIDTLLRQVEQASNRPTLSNLGLDEGEYALVTLHRPSNVDSKATLGPLVNVLVEISRQLPVVFPVHPRTAVKLKEFELIHLLENEQGIKAIEPQGYNDFLALSSQAKVIVTDSGGLQEESTALDIPCLTMRENTERPITVDQGTSTLCGSDADRLRLYLNQVVSGHYKAGSCPELWDGRAAERIVEALAAS